MKFVFITILAVIFWVPFTNADAQYRDLDPEIAKEIAKKDLPAGRSVYFYQPFSRHLFKDLLKKEKIPFEAKIRNNDEWIVWNENDASRVEIIEEKVEKETKAYMIKQFEEKKKNASNKAN
ncbi:MAG: hypothetical protein ABW148_15550 [Sedimenticola sp.]